MNLHVFTCGVWPSEQIARDKMWIMFKSAEKFGIDLYMYGNGTPQFPGYRAMCHDMQLEYLKTLPSDITHVLYTEGWDAFFTAPLSEIIHKYKILGSPQMLIAAFYQLANVSKMESYIGCFDDSIRYRYPQVGGYIAELPYLIEMFERMLEKWPDTGDNCFMHYNAWKEGWYRPMLDSNCKIFQVGDEDCMTIENPDYGKLYNRVTGFFPCILHLSGGYTDPETGKDERLIPWAKRLGIID